jgi:hypothetical protein
MALRHAAEWAIRLLQWERLPTGPILHGKTNLHRGMSDYVFHVPTGAFFRPKKVHEHHRSEQGGDGDAEDDDRAGNDDRAENDDAGMDEWDDNNEVWEDEDDFEEDEVEVEDRDGDEDDNL